MRTKGELLKAWRESVAKPGYVEVGRGVWIVGGAGLKKDGIEEVEGEKVDDGHVFLSTDTGDCFRILDEQELIERMEQSGNLVDYEEFHGMVFDYAANGDTAFDTCRQDSNGEPIPKLTETLKRCVRETAEEVVCYFHNHPECDGFETLELDEIVKEVFDAFEESNAKEGR